LAGVTHAVVIRHEPIDGVAVSEAGEVNVQREEAFEQPLRSLWANRTVQLGLSAEADPRSGRLRSGVEPLPTGRRPSLGRPTHVPGTRISPSAVPTMAARLVNQLSHPLVGAK
jgi:hypothetical protein